MLNDTCDTTFSAVDGLQTEEARRILSQLDSVDTSESSSMTRYVHPRLLVRRRWCVVGSVQVQLGWRSTSHVALSAWTRSEPDARNEHFVLLRVCSICLSQQSRGSATSGTKECNAGRRARALVADGCEGVAWECSFHGSGVRFTVSLLCKNGHDLSKDQGAAPQSVWP